MKYHLVTSLNSKIWNKFAHKTVGSFFNEYRNNNNENFEFVTWFDREEEAVEFLEGNGEFPDNFKFTSLDKFGPYVDFERKYAGDIPLKDRGMKLDKIAEGARFRFNYIPFAKKVYSWAATYLNIPEGDVLVWYDADIILKRRIDEAALVAFLPEQFDVSFLDRDFPMYAAETGWFMLRRKPEVDQFVMLMLQIYGSGFIFDMAEWHDGFVFKTAMKLIENNGIRILNLNPVLKEMNVFERTMLADFMDHYKGNLKQQLKGNGFGPGPEETTLIEYDPENQ